MRARAARGVRRAQCRKVRSLAKKSFGSTGPDAHGSRFSVNALAAAIGPAWAMTNELFVNYLASSRARCE